MSSKRLNTAILASCRGTGLGDAMVRKLWVTPSNTTHDRPARSKAIFMRQPPAGQVSRAICKAY